ncbi:hypothetical protein ACEWY4_006898 [Coilia grayii]|uniref:C-type lectin domain-containing protein n=1 Tax=Coilia grayii TaxID=363190 RepID=A0ABD1KER1_9TELE
MDIYQNTTHNQRSQTQTSEQGHDRPHKEYRLYILVVVSFGLLCVLQVCLNVYFWHAGRSCPNEWRQFGSNCYYISASHKNWTESRQECHRMEAELIIINSPEEQEFVKALSARAWIGLSYNGKGWIWVDGTQLTTEYWMTGEPNNLLENCTESWPRFSSLETWNDQVCSFETHSICKRAM